MGMILDVCRRRHMRAQFYDVCLSAAFVESSFVSEFLDDGEDVYRFFVDIEFLYSLVNFLMFRFIESFGVKDFSHHGEGVFIYHQRSEHDFLYIGCLWLQMSIVAVNLSAYFFPLFCHFILFL